MVFILLFDWVWCVGVVDQSRLAGWLGHGVSLDISLRETTELSFLLFISLHTCIYDVTEPEKH